MKDIREAKELATMMIKIGRLAGREVRCVITNMDEPIGKNIGNSLEVVEAIKALKGEMTDDIREIIMALGTQMILMSGKTTNQFEAEQMINESIESGRAFEKFKELVKRQGGDISYIENPDKFKRAEYIIPVFAEERGALKSMDTEMIGNISVYLGAGRMRKEDTIDAAAGIIMNQKIGNVVEVGQVLAYIHTNEKNKIDGAIKNLKEAFVLDSKRVARTKTILGIVK